MHITCFSLLTALVMGSALALAVGLCKKWLLQIGNGMIIKVLGILALVRFLFPFSIPEFSLLQFEQLSVMGMDPFLLFENSGFYNSGFQWPAFLFLVLLVVWFGGTIYCSLRDWRHFRKFYRNAEACDNVAPQWIQNIAMQEKAQIGVRAPVRVLQHSLVPYPSMIGFFRPTIFLPEENWNEEELRNIFSHELMHFHHGDTWIRFVFLFMSDLFWWNPVLCYLAQCIDDACEFHCDFAVTLPWKQNERLSYTKTIIRAVEFSHVSKEKNLKVCTAFAQGEEHVLLARFANIMRKERKVQWKPVVASLMLVVFLGMLSFAVLPAESYSISDSRMGEAYVVPHGSGLFDLYVDGEYTETLQGEEEEISLDFPVYHGSAEN